MAPQELITVGSNDSTPGTQACWYLQNTKVFGALNKTCTREYPVQELSIDPVCSSPIGHVLLGDKTQ